MAGGTVATTSRSERAAVRLIEIAQSHPAGTRLGTKGELRKECAVSVGTFNEALALAQSRGYISLKPGPGGGIFASDQSAMARLGNSILSFDTAQPSATDAIRIRDALEPLLADDAVESAGPEEHERMFEQLVMMREGIDRGDYLDFVRANWGLHRAIAEASPSGLLQSMYLSVLEILQTHAIGVASAPGAELPDYVEDRLVLHEEIVQAIVACDKELARTLISRHNLSG